MCFVHFFIHECFFHLFIYSFAFVDTSKLGLNDDASMASMSPMGSVSSFGGGALGAKEMRAREKRRKEELRAKLSGLPAPQYEYELVAPDVSRCFFSHVDSPVGNPVYSPVVHA